MPALGPLVLPITIAVAAVGILIVLAPRLLRSGKACGRRAQPSRCRARCASTHWWSRRLTLRRSGVQKWRWLCVNARELKAGRSADTAARTARRIMSSQRTPRHRSGLWRTHSSPSWRQTIVWNAGVLYSGRRGRKVNTMAGSTNCRTSCLSMASFAHAAARFVASSVAATRRAAGRRTGHCYVRGAFAAR